MVDFNDYKIVNICNIANIERAIKDVIYPAGCIKVLLSATRGQIEYMESAGLVESKYAVIKPIIDINRKYLFVSIQKQWEEFLYKYQTGINLQIGVFEHLKIYVHNKETQEYIADAFETLEIEMQKEMEMINEYKNMKKSYMGKLFV
nr:MAG TPA: hypothetical protein [Caudoviricetes sp.]